MIVADLSLQLHVMFLLANPLSYTYLNSFDINVLYIYVHLNAG